MTETDLVPQQPAEVQVLDGRTRALYDRISAMKIASKEDLQLIADIMAQVKIMEKVIEERFEPHLKRAWETHKGLCADKRKALERLIDAEKLAKEKIGFFFIEAEATGQQVAISGLTVSDEWTGEVTDAGKLPRRFLVPNLDKLKEHTKLYKEATKIPGWKVTKKKRVAQTV